jgi:hypothetical protein
MTTESPPPLPSAVNVKDFPFQSSHPASPHSTTHDVRSSAPAPPLMHPPPTFSPPHDYNFSNTVYDESSAPPTDHEDAYATTDDEMARLAPGAETTSSRSSISSLPVSVVAGTMGSSPEKPVTPIRKPPGLGHTRSGSGFKSLGRRDGALQDRDREMTPFRHPSSVRAMQMRDEFDDDDDDITPGHRRCGSRVAGGRLSTFSTRSSNSTNPSPTKRGGGNRSSQSSPHKSGSKLRKEFPLVLLHCSLLSPSLGLQMKMPESWWLKEVLPEKYWNRWKALEEKVLGNSEVRTRGVLIPHPQADYDLLEERLLESLELERPRLRSGHFLGAEQEKSESGEEESEAESVRSSQCPDCGRMVATGVEMERKWEIKVYAANGLMRAGAWSAAWGEMEKVDVEVGVWMPAEVRREVEARLHDMGYTGQEEDNTVHGDMEESEEERRRREIYGSSSLDPQEKVDGLFDEEHHEPRPQSEGRHAHPATAQYPPRADLQSLFIRYLKALAQDRRNMVIALLSMTVLFYAMTTPVTQAASAGNLLPSTRPEYMTTTVTKTAMFTTVSECALATSTLLPEGMAPTNSISEAESLSVRETASPTQDVSASETTSTATAAAAAAAAAAIHDVSAGGSSSTKTAATAAAAASSEESQSVDQQVVAAVLAVEVPSAVAE